MIFCIFVSAVALALHQHDDFTVYAECPFCKLNLNIASAKDAERPLLGSLECLRIYYRPIDQSFFQQVIISVKNLRAPPFSS